MKRPSIALLFMLIAAGAVRFERAILGPLACRHRFVNDGDRAVNIAGTGFGFGERNLDCGDDRTAIDTYVEDGKLAPDGQGSRPSVRW
jgi:hypothetical protein